MAFALHAAPVRAQADDDLARIKASKKLLVGVSADYPPYSFYNSSYKIDGFDPALANELGKRLGAQVELNDFAFEGVLQALQLKQVDMVIAAVSVTPQRQQVVDFSSAYFIGADAVVARRDYPDRNIDTLDALAGKKVAAEKGSIYATFLKEELVDKGLSDLTDIFLYSDVDGMVRDLKAKRFDLMVVDRLPGRVIAKANNFRVVAEGLNEQRFAIAVRKGSTLRQALNDSLLQAQNDGTMAKLIDQYLGIAPADQEKPDNPTQPETVPTATPSQPVAPAPPACIDGMAFVADLNYDDKNMTAPPAFQPSQGFTKSWRARNSGNCDWAADYSLRFIFGNTPAAQMGGKTIVTGKVVKPGDTIDLSANLIAPGVYGVYQGFWQMYNSAGQAFGERMWVGINVPNPNPPPPPPPPPQPSGVNFNADRTTINSGECVNFNWNVQNVSGVWFYPQGQNYQSFGRPGVSTEQVCPGQSTTYELRIQRNDGSLDFRQVGITVNQPPQGSGPQITQFSVDPGQINPGQCVTIRWQTAGNVGNVTITRNGAGIWDGAPSTGQSQDCPPNGTITYGILAYGPQGQNAVQTTRQVNVILPGPPQPTINSLTHSAIANINGQMCVNVTWDVSNARTVTLLRGYGQFSELPIDSSRLQGYYTDCGTYKGIVGYRVIATNAQGQAVQKDVTVNFP